MNTGRTVGFFTFGVPADSYDLPHPHLGLPVILLIRRVLLRAFQLLRKQNFQLATATEDEVTAALLHLPSATFYLKTMLSLFKFPENWNQHCTAQR
jgi:hypothetical protein